MLTAEGNPPPRAGVRRWLLTHPAPRFLVSGGLTALVDVGTLAALHSALGAPLAVSTAAAYCVAFAVNFRLSRHWTFSTARQGRAHHQAARYLLLVLVNLAATLAIVTGLSAVGVYYLLAKVISIAVIALGNFFAYRYWVFR